MASIGTLRVLHLSFTDVNDKGLQELGKLKQLTTVILGNTRITDAGLKELARLENLTTLDLGGGGFFPGSRSFIKVTADGFRELARIKTLVALDVCGLDITDETLKAWLDWTISSH